MHNIWITNWEDINSVQESAGIDEWKRELKTRVAAAAVEASAAAGDDFEERKRVKLWRDECMKVISRGKTFESILDDNAFLFIQYHVEMDDLLLKASASGVDEEDASFARLAAFAQDISSLDDGDMVYFDFETIPEKKKKVGVHFYLSGKSMTSEEVISRVAAFSMKYPEFILEYSESDEDEDYDDEDEEYTDDEYEDEAYGDDEWPEDNLGAKPQVKVSIQNGDITPISG